MVHRFLLSIKKCCQLSSIFDHIIYVNNRHLCSLLNFSVLNMININFCNNIIHYLSLNVDNLGLNEIDTLVKNSLFTNYTINSKILDNILSKLINKCQFNGALSLNTLYHLLLLDSHCFLSSDRCVELLDKFRLSSDNIEQLNLLYVLYSIQFFRSDITSFYTPQINNFVKYVKLLSPEILVRSKMYSETQEVKQIKKIMDELNLEYVSGITGHIYSPIILKGTNMAIDINYERGRYYESSCFARIVSLKQFMMNEMGWKLRFIPIDEWKCSISDKDKRNYLSKFICKYYVDTQFDKNPPWVPI